MEMKCKKSAQRLLALILCVAMLLPVFPQSAWALTVPGNLSQYVAQVDAKTVLDGITYSGGTTSHVLEYDCGDGLTGDGAKSAIKIVTGTGATQFDTFCTELRKNHAYAAGWTAVKTDSNGNKFCKFVGGDGAYSVYTYYLANYGETRIIVDTNLDTVNGYSYTPQEGVSVEPKLVQWGLSTSPSGYHIDAGGSTANYRTNRENNGSLIIIRMPDNSLFFHDGGILAQMSDEAAAELLAYCRELTGTTGTSTKMVINTWFVSHAHDDHFEAFTRFININHEHFDLKNVVYNIDYHRTVKGTGTTPASKDLKEALEIVRSHYPDVRFYKPHTGETFPVAGIQFEVMYTHEDRLYPANGNLSFSEDLSTGTNVLDLGGTYRNITYNGEHNGKKKSDFNDTSTVLKITFPNEITGGNNDVTAILYADLNLAEDILKTIQPASGLNADIIMVPHHGFDNHPELIRNGSSFRAKIYLYMQSFVPIFGADGDRGVTDPGPNYNDDSNYYHSGKIGYGGTKIRTDLLDDFKAMFDVGSHTHEKAAGDANDTYRIYWGGSETAIIDLKAVANLPGNAKNPEISACVETREAMNFEYTGWKMNQDSQKASDGVFSMQTGTATTTSVTGTSQIKFTPVTSSSNIIQEGRYLLMSSKYGHIMSHDATAPFQIPDGNNAGSTTAGSIKYDADGNSENTYYFSGNDVILDHSDRDHAIWNLRQYSQGFNACNDKTGAGNNNGDKIAHLNHSNFSGKGDSGECYLGIEMQKRTKNYPYASNITYRPSNAYWYSLKKSASEDYQTLFLCFNTEIAPFKNQYRNSLVTGLDANGNNALREWFILENMFDGKDSYLLYFKKRDDSVYYVVCCDELGTWGVRKYVTDSTSSAKTKINAEIDELKIKLYEYKETSGTKKVAVSGYKTYNVDIGTTQDAIRNAIMQNLVVSDPDRQNQHIPCNGTESKVGYYHLDSSDIAAIRTDRAGSYTVDVFYTSDTGATVDVGDVTVVVAASISSNIGMVSQNATGAVHVYDTTASTALEDYVTIRYNGSTINVTMDMLKDASGKAVSTATANQTLTGLRVVFEGITYSNNFTLKVGNGTIPVDQSKYPEPGSVTAGKGTTTSQTDFANTGVANIELSATAKPVEKGVDLIFIVDLSSSMRYYTTSNVYACGPAYKTKGVKNEITYEDYRDSYNTSENLNEFKSEYLAEHPGATDAEMESLFYASFDTEVVKKVWKEDWWIYTRMYALEESLKSTIKSLRDSGKDVNVAIADFGDINHWEFDNARLDTSIENDQHFLDADRSKSPNLEKEFSNHLNFILGKNDPANFPSQPYHIHQTKWGTETTDTGTLDSFVYTNVNNNINYYSNKGTLASGADAFQPVDTLTDARMLEIVEMMRIQNGNMLGTNYDLGLETAYRLAYAKQKENEVNGEDRDIVCIFMSDGAAMQYNFMSGRSQSEAWAKYLIGETDEILHEDNIKDKYVLTSNFYDATVNQNPLLKDMGQKLLELLKAGNLYMAGSSTQKYRQCSRTQTDFFAAMREVGVSCNWELFFKIAYSNYQFAQGNNDWYNALVLEDHKYQTLPNGEKNDLYLPRNKDFCAKTMYRVVHSLRAPSFKRDAQGNVTTEQYIYQTLSPYYYFYNTEGKNWWAEALKGDNDGHYPVPNRKAKSSDNIINTTNGDVLNHFSTETGLALDGKDYISGVQGLDVDLYTIGFSLSADNAISYEVESKVLDNVASGPAYHYEASSKDGLTDALKSITSSMSKSATGAYYMDTMGAEFDLSTVKTVNGVEVNQTPAIYVKEYILDESKPIYKDTNNDDVADEIVGYQRAKDADGNYIFTVRETIKFEAEPFGATSDKIKYASSGTKVAYSDLVFTVDGNGVKTYTDIWDDTTNVIFGRLVKYNANKVGDKIDVNEDGTFNRDNGDVVDGRYKIDLTGDGVGDQTLEPETFFWIIGMIGETEMVLEYQAYLEGSMEGEKDYKKDVYPTNKSAILYYTDYIGNKQSISTVSPKFPWGGIPQISHGFYVVDERGEPILKDGKLQIVGLVDYANIALNSTGDEGEKQYTKTSVDKIASELFNSSLGYELYNPNATYTVVYNESKNNDNYNSWTTSDASKTTLVSVNGLEHSEATSGGTTTPNTVLNKTQVLFAVVMRQSDLVVDKYVEAVSGSTNKFILTLEAYTKYGSCGLNSDSILKEVLSDYFILDPNDVTAVKVYTYPCTGINDGVPAFGTTGTELPSATINLSSSDSSGRMDIIEISGFDYAANYLRAYGDNLGCKLVVKVSIVTRAGFWGGNNVPTNEADTAIYNSDDDDTPVETFPIPQVNVPVDVEVNVEDKTYYYGTDGKTGADLNPTVTVNGTQVTINGDKLEPAKPWMDDFTDIKWNDDSNKPSSGVDGKTPNDYTFSVTVTPKTDGSENNTTSPDKPSNIVGDPVVSEGVTDQDTAHVNILVPELTFKDSSTDYNTPVDGYDFERKDYVSVNWVDSQGQNLNEIPPVEGQKPTLDLTYTTEGNVDSFTTDTKVNVTVKDGDEDITNVVNFKWQECKHNVSDIPDHKGNENYNEFWVHVLNIVPDTVVIDFGLDVVIDVLANDEDIKGKGYTMIGLSLSDGSNYNESSVEGAYGVLTMETVDGKQVVRYSLKNNGMQMNVQDTFMYYVKSEGGKVALSATVTVIPATTIYFEDDFGSVTYSTYEFYPGNKDKDDVKLEESQWSHDASDSATQHEDRPGVDAANLYGYDGSYTNCSQFSLNGSHMFTAKQEKVNGETVVTYGTASFDFWGTGFDVISMSSGQTGTITVEVNGSYYDEATKTNVPVRKTYIVDTYYGFRWEKDEQGNVNWYPVKNDNSNLGDVNTNTLYQVPVMKVSGLNYGKYTAVITVSYNDFFSHGQYGDTKQYDFYLDAIRIYDPANDGKNNDVIEGAYVADQEGWPEYFELRNMIIKANDFNANVDSQVVPGIIFIDSNSKLDNDSSSSDRPLSGMTAAISDYANFGPNNELYLAPGQAIAFNLAMEGPVDTVQLALKSVGGSAYVKVYDVDDKELKNVVVPSKEVDEAGGSKLETATDLYYDITSLNNKTVVIKNTSGAILSITNIKVTYTQSFTQPTGTKLTITRQSAEKVLSQLNSSVGEEDPGDVINGTIDLKGASLSFEDEILTNLYYTVSGIEATEMGLLTWSSEPANGTIDNAENIFTGAVYDEAMGHYMVQTDGIAAKNLGDDIYMRVYAKTENGIVYSNVTKYSPKQYALSRLEKSQNEDMKALCVAMLNYGAAAQEYFGYKTEDLMNASLTAQQQALVSAYSADLFAGAVAADASKVGSFAKTEGFSGKSASVSFEGAFAINYYFTAAAEVAGDMTFCYWSAADYAKAEVLTADNATGTFAMEKQSSGAYWAQVAGIAAKELDDTYYVAAVYTDAAGNRYCTGVVAYSLSCYCLNNAKEGKAMQELAAATAMYGYYAKRYFSN